MDPVLPLGVDPVLEVSLGLSAVSSVSGAVAGGVVVAPVRPPVRPCRAVSSRESKHLTTRNYRYFRQRWWHEHALTLEHLS